MRKINFSFILLVGFVYFLYGNERFYVPGLTHSAQITIINASGSKLLSKQVSAGEYVNISTLQPGLYIVKLLTDKGVVLGKIFKK